MRLRLPGTRRCGLGCPTRARGASHLRPTNSPPTPHATIIAPAPALHAKARAKPAHLAPFEHAGTPGCTLPDFHAGLCQTEGHCAAGPRRRTRPAFFLDQADGAAQEDAAAPVAAAEAMVEEGGGEGGDEGDAWWDDAVAEDAAAPVAAAEVMEEKGEEEGEEGKRGESAGGVKALSAEEAAAASGDAKARAALAEVKLWEGAGAAGWRVWPRSSKTKNTGHYYYESPAGQRFTKRGDACDAGKEEEGGESEEEDMDGEEEEEAGAAGIASSRASILKRCSPRSGSPAASSPSPVGPGPWPDDDAEARARKLRRAAAAQGAAQAASLPPPAEAPAGETEAGAAPQAAQEPREAPREAPRSASVAAPRRASSAASSSAASRRASAAITKEAEVAAVETGTAVAAEAASVSKPSRSVRSRRGSAVTEDLCVDVEPHEVAAP